MFHPASLLLAWFGFAVALQSLPLVWISIVVVASLMLTAAFAARRGFRLLRRSRWLLLSLGVLYLIATPGEYLSGIWGDIGLTHEGVQQGGEQIGRLLALLASLALLHQMTGAPGFLAGLYWWLKPLPWRDSTVVRLMLVLEMAEQQGRRSWREWLTPPQTADNLSEQSDYHLSMPNLRVQDKLLMAGIIGMGLAFIYIS